MNDTPGIDIPGRWSIAGRNTTVLQIGRADSSLVVDNTDQLVALYGRTYATMSTGPDGVAEIGGGAAVYLTAQTVAVNGVPVAASACGNFVATAADNGVVAQNDYVRTPGTCGAVHGVVADASGGIVLPAGLYDVSWAANVAAGAPTQLALCVDAGTINGIDLSSPFPHVISDTVIGVPASNERVAGHSILTVSGQSPAVVILRNIGVSAITLPIRGAGPAVENTVSIVVRKIDLVN